MNNFEFYNPVKVVFGEGVLNDIGKHVKEYGKKAVLVTYTDISFYGDLFDRLHKSMEDAGVEYMDYLGVEANPTLKQAQKGIEICRSFDADIVIGVGGGSAMDCAKVVAAGVKYPHELNRMISFSHSDDWQIPPKEALPMIMIPTLPATGSEMNPTAVITEQETHRKSYVWAPECLYAKIALVDPSLSKTLPVYQTACGAFDTIAHTLESYFNGEKTQNISLQDRLQEGLVKAVLENLPKVMEDPFDIQTRGVMQWASAIALNGWVLSGTYGWAPMHQLGHVVSTRYKATHGATLSVIMIAWLKYWQGRSDNERYVQFAERIYGAGLKEATAQFEESIKSSGVQTRLSEFGATEEDIDMLVDDVVRISFGADGMLASVPPISKEDVKEIYTIALKG
jgi:alcohol dehydrogenase YqhD (iron-dependent ADH family)